MGLDPNVRRRISFTGSDGIGYDVVAAKRGVPLREQVLDGTGAADTAAGFVVGTILGLVVTGLLEIGATRRSTWKLGVVRRGGFPRRINHQEHLPPGVDPHERMVELVTLYSSDS